MNEYEVTLRNNGTAVAGWSGKAKNEEDAVAQARKAHGEGHLLDADVALVK